MIKRLILACGIFISHLLAASAFAQTVISQEFFLSKNPSFTLLELESESLKPYRGVLNQGYGNEYVWLKLHVTPDDVNATSGKIQDWILRIRPTYLGEIALYDTKDISDKRIPLQPQKMSGQRYGAIDNGYDSINHGFRIPASTEPRDIYLRLKTSTTRLISTEVLPETKAYEEDRKQLVLSSSFLSILAFFMFWAALQWLILKERLLALFVIKQALVLCFGVTNLGYLKMLFGEGADWIFLDGFVKINNFTYVGIYYLFEITFLSHFVTDQRYCRYAYAALAIWGLALSLFFAGFEAIGLQINMYLTLASPIIFLLLVFKTKSAKDVAPGETPPLLSRKILVSFYLFYVLAAYWVVLPNIGIIKAKNFTLTLAVYVSIISSALMATMLMLRTRNLNRQKAHAEAEAGLANQRFEQAKAQREQQSRFISMLTHELKTPIGVAKISLDAMGINGVEHDRIQRALRNMNDVIERCRISDAVDSHRFQVRSENFDLRNAVFECIDILPCPERVKVFEGNNVFVYSDSQLVSIIIANLLDNALKYSPVPSDVDVRIFQESRADQLGTSLVISNLIGPAGEPDADKVFQKYYRAKKAEGKSGSGLGLYLTAGIADLLGGKVSYRTAESRIEFELWLPD